MASHDDLDPTLWHTYRRELFPDGGVWLHQIRCRDGMWARRVLSEHPCGTYSVVMRSADVSDKDGWADFERACVRLGATA